MNIDHKSVDPILEKIDFNKLLILDMGHPENGKVNYLVQDFNEAVQDNAIELKPCAYLHNYVRDNVMTNEFYAEHLQKAPVFLKGDATSPNMEGIKIIAHICNDIGGWGKGFVLALSKRWQQPEKEYRKWFKEGLKFHLGGVQFVQVRVDILVAKRKSYTF